jgi:hypothetical protein
LEQELIERIQENSRCAKAAELGSSSRVISRRALATAKLREIFFSRKSGVYFRLEKTPEKRGNLARKMSVLEADLASLVVRTNQLSGILDVSKNYVVVLTRSGVLEPLRKPNGTAVRGHYPLVASMQLSADT